MGYFVIKDRAGLLFSAVSGDLKLEKSKNRYTSGPGSPATVGKSGDDAAPTEFALLFHEILAITNLLQSLTSPKLLDHNETNIRHDVMRTIGLVFDQNVKKLLDFVNARVNPFRMPEARIPLYNIVSNQKVCLDVEQRLLNCFKNGEQVHQQICKEMFVDRTRKLTDTLHRRMLPSFVTENPKDNLQVSFVSIEFDETLFYLKLIESQDYSSYDDKFVSYIYYQYVLRIKSIKAYTTSY